MSCVWYLDFVEFIHHRVIACIYTIVVCSVYDDQNGNLMHWVMSEKTRDWCIFLQGKIYKKTTESK